MIHIIYFYRYSFNRNKRKGGKFVQIDQIVVVDDYVMK